MNRAKLNYFIDLILAIAFFINAGTGIIKYFELFGFRLRDLVPLHDISGFIFILFAVIHIILHWSWIASMTKSFFKKQDEPKE